MSPLCKVKGLGPVWVICNGEFSTNAYICSTGTGNECFLIDPGLDGELISKKLNELKMVPKQIFCTHGHFDHIGSVKKFEDEYGIKSYINRLDVKVAKQSNFLLTAFRMKQRIVVPEFAELMDDGDLVTINGVQLQFIACPGHTDGSCALLVGDVLFSGDTLYSRAVGLSKLPGENKTKLKASIELLLETIGDHVMVLPGHGPPSLMGTIKCDNIKLREFLDTGNQAEY